jgi:hypothetical protein
MRFTTLAVVVALLLAPAAPASAASPNALGTKLVKRFLTQVMDKDIPGLRRFMSPAFQLQRADGSRVTKAEYLSNPSTVRSFQMRGLRATTSGNILVATFEASSDTVVNGQQFKTGFGPRIATFVHTKSGWQITSYANFNTPK